MVQSRKKTVLFLFFCNFHGIMTFCFRSIVWSSLCTDAFGVGIFFFVNAPLCAFAALALTGPQDCAPARLLPETIINCSFSDQSLFVCGEYFVFQRKWRGR